MLEKQGVYSTGSGYGLVADFCEHLIGLRDCLIAINFLTSRVTIACTVK